MKYLSIIFLLVVGCNKPPTTNETLPSDGQSITLYFIPSPFGINWTSPKKLLTSIALNYFTFKPHFMGHVEVQVSCTDLNNNKNEFISGMSHQKLPVTKDIFKNHVGMGVMFVKNPGKLDDAKAAEQELINLLKNPGSTSGINFVRFIISKAACTRISKYYEEYKKYNIGRYYGLYNRPLYGEGAGCSAFGASFIEVAGLMTEELKQEWSYNLNLPKKLIGRPLFEQDVYFWRIFTEGSSWAESSEEAFPFFFWEPDKMYNWVTKTLNDLKNQPQYSTVKLFNTVGLQFNGAQTPVPTEPIWKKTDRLFYSELIDLNKELYNKTL